MKKVLLVCMVALLLCAGNAFAAGISVDGFVNYNSEAESDYGSAIGFGAGVTYDLSEVAVENLAARVDVAYLKYEEDFFGVDVTFRRIPIFAGVRYNAPIEGPVKVFGDAGLEVSLDNIEVAIPSFSFLGITTPATTADEDETNIGAAIGAGVAYPVNDMISIGANARYHIVDGSYFSAGLFVGFAIQ
jgi:opacity protein-like surface antigen